jgi:pyruvate/2-oxoglutarate dehydrogenase complex dihydrolipoamide dehydrogenase (E3) component
MMGLGAGPIGCELAQAFARLGSEVTLFDQASRPLPNEPTEASRIIADQLRSDGVTLEMEASVVRVDGRTFALADGREPTGDQVLVAAGRAPNIEGLGLAAAGVSFDGHAGLVVDDRLRTTNPRIYAAGDVATHFRFTHAADAMARIVLRNALFGGRAKVSALVMPWCTYTSPEVAHVGMTAEEAEAAGKRVVVLNQELTQVDRARVEGVPEGFARAYVSARSGRVLGATMVGPHAGEAISEMALAITHKLTIQAVGSTIHPYPTMAEAWKKLGDQWQRERIQPWLAQLLRRWLALTRVEIFVRRH